MGSLDIQWLAVYEKGMLPQFNEDGTENLFGDIDQSKLKMFILRSMNGPGYWAVNLKNGTFKIREETFRWAGFGKGVDYRLIYFRRVRQIMGAVHPAIQHRQRTEVQHLGWQATVDGKNHQRIMHITESGACSIEIK